MEGDCFYGSSSGLKELIDIGIHVALNITAIHAALNAIKYKSSTNL